MHELFPRKQHVWHTKQYVLILFHMLSLKYKICLLENQVLVLLPISVILKDVILTPDHPNFKF